jgi:chromate reductase, NAD(P)H dehydrogenase (quinone)
MAITIISGTNRMGSRTLLLSRALRRLYAEENVETTLLDLAELPAALFTPAAYDDKPADFDPFQGAVLGAEGLVVVVPEYNGSFPGALKLFIDMLPFPESFEERKVAFVGIAGGYFGGLRAVEQLQMVFAYRNAKLFHQRVFLPRAAQEFDAEGRLTSPKTIERLTAQTRAFIDFCSPERTP